MIQSSCYDQVLAGILPYHDSGHIATYRRIKGSVRLSHPAGRRQSLRLQDPVWNVITTGRSRKPEQRCELSVMHHVFSTSSQQEVQNVKLGELNTQNNGSFIIAERFWTLKQSDNNVEKSFHGLPLSSSFCGIRNRKSRGVSARWIG